MQFVSNDLIFFIAGSLSGSLISWSIMKQRAHLYKESTEKQIKSFEKEALLMKDNINSKEKHINTLTVTVSEKEADIRSLRVKIDEQKEDLEKLNENFKAEFKNLAREILDKKERASRNKA